jgi:hypothetical protein
MTGQVFSAVLVGTLLAMAAALAFSGRSRMRRRLLGKVRLLLEGGNSPAGSGKLLSTQPEPGLRDPAMMLELVAAMLDAGSGIGRSLELVAAAASPDYQTSLRPVNALGFAALTGAPSSAILYAQAARMRRERFRSAEKRAASLSVKLVVPLGLCSLPAFICLGVVPVLLALVPSGS